MSNYFTFGVNADIYLCKSSAHCVLDQFLSWAYELISSMDGARSEPSSEPYRESAITVPENVSPCDDSSLLRSCT